MRNWLNSLKQTPKIIGIQEIKASTFLVDVALNHILPDYHRVISPLDEGRGKIALLFHPSLKLIASGTISLVRAAWAQVQIVDTILSIISIYAPSHSPRDMMSFWHVLKTTFPKGNSIFLGDFNMMEFPKDSTGPTPLIEGRRQLESWRLLKTRLNLTDALFLPQSFIGTRFTKRSIHGDQLDQSRLERFYLSDCGHWIHSISHLKHVQSHTLCPRSHLQLPFAYPPCLLHLSHNINLPISRPTPVL